MVTTQHVEIEAKYDLAEGADVPGLLGVADIAQVHDLAPQVLTATYYDTSDLALQRHRITLRRRTGGSDDGWHLKLPVTGGERLELRRPLGTRSAVPAPLRRLLVAVLGDQRLVPVATLVTRRATSHLVASDGTVLAELADDLVTVERDGADAVRWRELEIELVEGDPEVLALVDKAVRQAGARPSAATSKIGRVLAVDASAQPVSWTPRLRAPTAAGELLAETASALRVLDAMARAGRPGAAAGLESGLRRRLGAVDLARRLGVAGDDIGAALVAELVRATEALAGSALLDEAADLVRATVEAQPAELVLGPVARRLDREVAARRRADQQSLTELLDSARWQRLVAGNERGTDGSGIDGSLLGGDRGPRLAKALPDLTVWSGRRLERRLRALDDATDRELDARVTAARRTAATALLAADMAARSRFRGFGSAGHVGTSAELLDRLAVVVCALDLTRATGVAAHLAGENGFTFGRVHGLLAARAATIARERRAERKALRRARRKA